VTHDGQQINFAVDYFSESPCSFMYNDTRTYIKCACFFSFSRVRCRSWRTSIHIQWRLLSSIDRLFTDVIRRLSGAIYQATRQMSMAPPLQQPGPKPRVWTYGLRYSGVFSSRRCGLSTRRTRRRHVHRPPSFICGASPVPSADLRFPFDRFRHRYVSIDTAAAVAEMCGVRKVRSAVELQFG